MAAHSSILAWRIPWTEEPGGLHSMGSQRVRHNWNDLACIHIDWNLETWIFNSKLEKKITERGYKKIEKMKLNVTTHTEN